MVTHTAKGVFLGQPHHCICTNASASRALSALSCWINCSEAVCRLNTNLFSIRVADKLPWGWYMWVAQAELNCCQFGILSEFWLTTECKNNIMSLSRFRMLLQFYRSRFSWPSGANCTCVVLRCQKIYNIVCLQVIYVIYVYILIYVSSAGWTQLLPIWNPLRVLTDNWV